LSTAKQSNGVRSGKAQTGHTRIPVKLHRNVSLVKVNDTHLAEELLARRKLAGLLAGRLTDNVLLVRPGQESAVIEELRKIGQSPQVIRGGST
jgi:hypothetical protein